MSTARYEKEAAGGQVHPFWRGPTITGSGYQVRIEHREHHFSARVHGDLPIDLFVSMLHVLGIESDGISEPAMLLDLRRLSTNYSPNDLMRVGQELALSFVHMRRVALLVLPRQLTRISERTARRNGLNLWVFVSLHTAHEWLGGTA